MIKSWLKEVWTTAKPPQVSAEYPSFWKGAIIGIILLVAIISGTAGFLSRLFWLPPFALLLGGIASGIGIYFISAFLIGVVIKLLDSSNRSVLLAVGGRFVPCSTFR